MGVWVRKLVRNQRGSQTVEWMALTLVVLTLGTILVSAVKNHKGLPDKFTAAIGRMIDSASGK